ncbi:WXG100 family type VII secretion target [Nocardia sp. NPDC051756]|uniref:WXG100 family type VII secretion target n=1 Tax=Nocardia sp. NPDC051756 TaxID=3154751 RepID=UPI00342B0E73
MPKFEVDTHQLRTAANHAAGIHDRIDGVLATLESKLGATGTPWGKDSFGKKFADGEKGYLAARNNLLQGIGGISGTFGAIADGQRDAAGLIDGQESNNTNSFGKRVKP